MHALCALFGYRITAHPLARYPGPWFAKVSDLYGLYHSFHRRLHLATYLNHRKYGPVIRHAPDKLLFSSIQALNDIYNNDNVVKSRAYLATLQGPDQYSLFNVIDRQAHRSKRRLIGQAVTERSMRTFEPTMMEEIDVFLRQLIPRIDDDDDGKGPQSINLSPRLRSLGLDVVGLLAFGCKLNTQTSSQYHFFKDTLPQANYMQNMKIQFPFPTRIRLTRALERLVRSASKMLATYRRHLEQLISSRMAEDKDAKHDLYSLVCDAVDTPGADSIQSSDLWAEAVFFLTAGGDTTATGLAAVFFYLSRSPTCYHKLCQEIRTTFASGTDIRGGPLLASCTYLRACINEALRLSPPVPGALWREQDPGSREPLIVDGHFVPRGTQVGVSIYNIHHNEAYFPEPFAYDPERWLQDLPEERRKAMNDAFVPFSTGYRGCAGKAMAYLEASLVVAKTLWYFDVKMAPGIEGRLGGGAKGSPYGRHREGEYQLHDVLSAMHDGPNLIFQPRDGLIQELM
ncbi:cytochrome P450 [Xylariomycetidae sp. FL2044]|nr:cytochrome P450 [Xylariomycetidae sp. FL2044]